MALHGNLLNVVIMQSIKGTGLEARQRIVSRDIQRTSGVDGNETAEDVDHASFKYIELSSMRKVSE